jgi:hypothetical protein
MAPDEEKAEQRGGVNAQLQQTYQSNVPGSEAPQVSDSAPRKPEKEHRIEAESKEAPPFEAPAIVRPVPRKIPRSERRGLLGQLTFIPEVEDPKTCSNGTKWLMTTIVALAAATSSTGTSISYRKHWN